MSKTNDSELNYTLPKTITPRMIKYVEQQNGKALSEMIIKNNEQVFSVSFLYALYQAMELTEDKLVEDIKTYGLIRMTVAVILELKELGYLTF